MIDWIAQLDSTVLTAARIAGAGSVCKESIVVNLILAAILAAIAAHVPAGFRPKENDAVPKQLWKVYVYSRICVFGS